MPLRRGAHLGPYEIESAIGAGGMGEVYRARDTRLDRVVAVKVLLERVSGDPDHRKRFEQEARAVSSLNHPNICTLFDVGRHDDTDFLVMEFLEGQTLAMRLQSGPLPLRDALTTATEIADALAAAHRAGVIHRDLKPGNVMLTKQGAKLLDFGLARRHRPTTDLAREAVTRTALTELGTIVGTVPYMAPEQLEGLEADARTDLFALGAVLYEMLTGRRAFEGGSQVSLIAAILQTSPPPASETMAAIPPVVDQIITTCLAKDPDERWQSATDLARTLRWLPGIEARPADDPWFSWRRYLATAAATTLVVASAILAWPDRPAESQARLSRVDIMLPTGHRAPGGQAPRFAVSPDGRRIRLCHRRRDLYS